MRCFYRAVALTAIIAAFTTAPALATDTSDVMAVVEQYGDAFNNGDMKSWSALCTDQTVIVDDFDPYVWQGANTCGDWWNALEAANKKAGVSDMTVTVEKPWNVMIAGDRAYVVEPAKLAFKEEGKSSTADGVWTLALQKQSAGWRIAAWAWADR